ncbi:MAG: ATP-dependent zinc metalloprotease FtsH [Actinomycetota bacterium]
MSAPLGDADRPRPPRQRRRFPPAAGWGIAVLVLGSFVVANQFSPVNDSREPIAYTSLLRKVTVDNVLRVHINADTGRIDAELKDGGRTTSQGPPGGMPDADIDLLDRHGVQREYRNPGPSFLGPALTWLVPFALVVAFFWWARRRAAAQMGPMGPMAGGVPSIGRSPAKIYTTERPKTTFGDVAGYGPVKEEITEVVEFLKHPNKFREIGARIPKGVLLVGPPGTGKTLLARAVAGEAEVPFMSLSGSDFMEVFVGVGAARVRDLFQTARKEAPAIIFVDEIDSIGRRRGMGFGGGHDERDQTLNKMLSEMDGFEATEGIVMIAATNRPDILDSALLRPGRFDRQILVPLPTLEERRAILTVHCRDKRLAREVDLDIVARGTPGMSGADLANLVNEAALIAVRRGVKDVDGRDFEAARDRVLMGLRRETMALSDRDKKVIAYHEGGHAVLAELLEHADPLHKVTILPTGMALGVTQQLPLEEKHIYQQPWIEDSLAIRLGGRVAEELIFGVVSTGANNDLVGATETARRMVREWGMSDRVGPMAWSGGGAFLGEEMLQSRDYADETARIIDTEAERILRQQEQRARDLLGHHRAGLEAVAAALLEHETLAGSQVRHLIAAANGHSGRAVNVPSSSGTPDAPPALSS